MIDTALALRDQVQDEQEDSDGNDSLATRTEPREMDFNSSANATGVLE